VSAANLPQQEPCQNVAWGYLPLISGNWGFFVEAYGEIGLERFDYEATDLSKY
jgi:hypothetical protein